MVDREELTARLERLRIATDDLVPPAGFARRVLAAAEARAHEPSWADAIVRYARWALVPAVVACAALAIATWTTGNEIDDALLIGASAGYLP